jgi:hypothetical protein
MLKDFISGIIMLKGDIRHWRRKKGLVSIPGLCQVAGQRSRDRNCIDQ